jgi:stage V sporulation protein SpoVS
MADTKISALPASTTPLAGTEVLPIVQSGVTKQVSVANLTAGRAVSALSLTSTNDASVNGLTVGRGAGAVASNTALGFQAINASATGTAVTAVGYQAGYLSTGAGNQLFGYSSGSAVTTGAKNVILGSYTGSAAPISATGSNFVVLSDGDGNIVASTKTANTFALPGGTLSTGTGIAFPATQSASTDANTLDDYEEGTWTPTVEGSTVAGTQTYTWRKATYTKIGNRVIIDFEILVSAKDATTSGSISITGLPFTANSNSGIPLGFAVVAQNGVTFAGADNTLVVSVTQSTTVLKVDTYPSTNNLVATALASAFRILGTTHYYV